jgi:hypothetical protein
MMFSRRDILVVSAAGAVTAVGYFAATPVTVRAISRVIKIDPKSVVFESHGHEPSPAFA